jgi:hypothetical protein
VSTSGNLVRLVHKAGANGVGAGLVGWRQGHGLDDVEVPDIALMHDVAEGVTSKGDWVPSDWDEWMAEADAMGQLVVLAAGMAGPA